MVKLRGPSLSISPPPGQLTQKNRLSGIRLHLTGRTNSPPAKVGVDLLWRAMLRSFETFQLLSPDECWLAGFTSEQMRWGETGLQCGTTPEEPAKAPQPFSSLTKTGTADSREYDFNLKQTNKKPHTHTKVKVVGRSHPQNQTTLCAGIDCSWEGTQTLIIGHVGGLGVEKQGASAVRLDLMNISAHQQHRLSKYCTSVALG